MGAIRRDFEQLFTMLSSCEEKEHICRILNYDMETAAPKGGMALDASNISSLQAEIFKLKKNPDYIYAIHKLYSTDFKSLDNWSKRLVVLLHRDLEKQKGISAKLDSEANELFNNAYITWLKAKEDSSYEEFKDTLQKIADMELRLVEARFSTRKNAYDVLLSDYEPGFTTKDLDVFFDELEKGIVPLYKAIRKAKYVPRHDFLHRNVPISKQEEFSRFLLKFNGFDFSRGSLSTTEHPFTEQFGKDDVRVTTKYVEDNFISNMYSVIHEGGHALFGLNIPEEVFTYHIGEGCLSMAKHESVSRFYENIIGRSKEYIHAIYPKMMELFHEEFSDVTEQDFYEGVNYIDEKNALRTEADELTYTLHIIIRYKLEKEIMDGKADFDHLNEKWNALYKEYLGIDVKDDAQGILQDVHWSSGFGYFPTYAMGNALNVIYLKKLDSELGFAKTVKAGKMDKILDWMKENVFAKAPLYDTKEWIKEITGEEFSATPYVDYLTKKFMKIYHLTKTDIKNANK
jgi:carboxypeptidase Taq